MTTRSVLRLIQGFHETSYGRDLYRELIKRPSWPLVFRKLRLRTFDRPSRYRVTRIGARSRRYLSLIISDAPRFLEQAHGMHYYLEGHTIGLVTTNNPKEIVDALIKRFS